MITKTKSMTMKRMKKNAKQIDLAISLQTLKKDHFFFKKPFPSLFWEKCTCRKRTCIISIRKAEARVEWADVWIKYREDRSGTPKFDSDMPIHEAFNLLSSTQLQNWMEGQEERLQIHLLDGDGKEDFNFEGKIIDIQQVFTPVDDGNAGG